MPTIAFAGVAHIHTPSFIKTLADRTDFAVKWVWDHDSTRASRRAEELKAKPTPNVSDLLSDPEVAAVVVCSETDRHEQLVLPAAKAKKHLFVEKPLGISSRDAYVMARAIEKAGLIFQTGYFMRSHPIHRFLRDEITAGRFGRITRARMSNCHRGALERWFDTEWRWMADPNVAGCGAFGDLGSHALDILIWLLGDVQSCIATVNPGTGAYGECDETGEGLLRFKNDAIGTVAGAWDDVANPVTLLISGTEAHATVFNGELYYQNKSVAGADGKTPWTKLPEALPHAFDLFLNAVAGDKSVPLVTASEAAYRSAVVEALYQSTRSGKWVAPKTHRPRGKRAGAAVMGG